MVGILGVLLVVLLWVGVQSLARRSNPDLPPDCDMLEVGEKCRHCQVRRTCSLVAEQENHEDNGGLSD